MYRACNCEDRPCCGCGQEYLLLSTAGYDPYLERDDYYDDIDSYDGEYKVTEE
jgi:hypothetical protein